MEAQQPRTDPGEEPRIATEPAQGQSATGSPISATRRDHLLSITDSALAYMSLEDMLSELLGRIREALEVDTAAVLLLDEDRGVLLARAA
ncbi:MAG TPA: hypothetical protein VEB65_08595, partial [Solirubrobacterales bacterium]|nr:hypothetical protein [Solirubrobacterales bacterium]